MARNAVAGGIGDPQGHRMRPVVARIHEQNESRTIVIRAGGGWPSLAVLCVCLLLLTLALLGQYTFRALDAKDQAISGELAGIERQLQGLEAGLDFASSRRLLLLSMRDHILKVNPKSSTADAYRYAELAVAASEKYPAVDPLLLLAIGVVESGFDPTATSHADARGLYQIWPATGRVLSRSLGWEYDETTLYDPEKNTELAALYLDVLFATYNDPQLVLAEYNGGPLNAGYFRASSGALASETRDYIPKVLNLHAMLEEQFSRRKLTADTNLDGVGLSKSRRPAPLASIGD
jgi:soluble lytic murein transglycosylase-like protein